MHFCPVCANLLLVERVGRVRMFCQTCPFVYDIVRPVWLADCRAVLRRPVTLRARR